MAVQECRRSFTRIIQFWAQLFSCFTSNYKTPHLPDNVILDILSRLPSRRVSIFRRVCKKWLELTSTIYFARIHLERQNCNTEKVLLMQCYAYEHKSDTFFNFNKEANGRIILKETVPDLNKPREYFTNIIHGSCNGIIVFKQRKSGHMSYLLNPTTHERINIRCNEGLLCGFFYNPSEKEYVLLFSSNTVNSGMVSYYFFSLETESIRNVCTFHYSSKTKQVYSNGSLYWKIDYNSNKTCEDSIMALKIETGVFSSFPHPDKRCGPTCKREHMHLLENSGQLLFYRVRKVDYINLWVLEDDDNNIWVKRYVVHLDWDVDLYPFKINDGDEANVKMISVLNVDNGELLLFWGGRGLFLYNLDEKKVRKINFRKMKLKGELRFILSASSYISSLVSLKVSAKHPNSGKFPTYGQVTIDLE